MSIKTIDSSFTDTGKGVEKKIDVGAQRMIYDVLQATQYSTPIPSTVRELATNAWDSQREKEIAIEILTGKKQASDYYIQRDGEQYKDSNFDHSYYSLEHLDTENNRVLIRHTYENGTGFCDRFEIIDHGVGLGDSRLEGVLSLGFSTKRNTSEGFGAFGLGAKVAFSTGVNMYQIETVHNGRKFKCNCYPYKTTFTVPRLNLKTGFENDFITFSDGTPVYYENTDEKNRTTVTFMTKKHNRGAFKEAVLDQLVYVPGIDLKIVDSDQDHQHLEKEVKAEVMYNSDSLILSKRMVFNKPHIVIVKSPKDVAGINYGLIDFKELELEEMYGSIGFKCPIRQSYRDENGQEVVITEGVAVTPSREKVIWNDSTKSYVLGVIENASKEASDLITERLQGSTDLFEWINSCQSIFQSLGDDSVLGRLSRIVDKQTLSPQFPVEPAIKFGAVAKMFGAIEIERVTVDYRGNVSIESVDFASQLVDVRHVYIKDANYNKSKNFYLCKTLGHGHFYTVKNKGVSEEDRMKMFKDKGATEIEKYKTFTSKVWKQIEKSSIVSNYSEIEVPKEILEEIEKVNETASYDRLSPADKRALEQKEVGFAIRGDMDAIGTTRPVFVLDKVEPKNQEIFYSEEDVYYFSKDEAPLAMDIARTVQSLVPSRDAIYKSSYSYRSCPTYWSITDSANGHKLKEDLAQDVKDRSLNMIQLNASLISKIDDSMNIRPITDLLYQRVQTEKGAVITVHPHIVSAYTAYLIGNFWDGFSYLNYFSDINKDIADKYRKLADFMGYYYNSYRFFTDQNKVWDVCEKLYGFHKDVNGFEYTEEELRQRSFREFIFTDIVDAHIVEQEYLDIFAELKDYTADVGGFLTTVSPATKFQSKEVSAEVIRYLEARDRGNWSWGEN